jgi:hypothetical protein
MDNHLFQANLLATQLRYLKLPAVIEQFRYHASFLSPLEQQSVYAAANLSATQYPPSQRVTTETQIITPEKKENPPPPAQLTKKEKVAALRAEITELQRRLRPGDLGSASTIAQEIQKKRFELEALEEEIFLAEDFTNTTKYYQFGEQVRFKIDDKYFANPKEEFSAGEGGKPFVKINKDIKEARFHKIIKPSRKYPDIVALEDFQITLEIARDPEAKQNGEAFGRYGTMYMKTGNTGTLFYDPHWMVDPDIELGQKQYAKSAWHFINSDGSKAKYLQYNKDYRLLNKEGEYMLIFNDYVGLTRIYAGASVIRLEKIAYDQEAKLPDKDLIAKAGDNISRNCDLPPDASTAEIAACAVKQTAKTGVEEIIPLIPELIPWWAYAIGALALYSTLRK